MNGPRIVVVTGTGTEIGKTHLSQAILRAWRRTSRVRGLKPVETGVEPGTEGADAEALRQSSSDVQAEPFGETFRAPVSPHLAARFEGRTLDVAELVARIHEVVRGYDGVLVELAGGLFSPLGDGVANLDLALALRPKATILAAPDRLGVLHEIGATTRAATSAGLALTAVVLVAPSVSDITTGQNADEVRMVTRVPVAGVIARDSVDSISESAVVARLIGLFR